jgi:orotidine-5'-phosphate decarboxylase
MKKHPRDYLAIALDSLQDISQIKRIICQTSSHCGTYKVGLELFTRFGPSVIDAVKKANNDIFLDLKYHDIPNTVAQAVFAASQLGVQFCTLHTQGGTAMMAAAAAAKRSAIDKGFVPPKLIGVTLLTSIDEICLRNELKASLPLVDYVHHLAGLALSSGMDGIVCSAADLPSIKKRLPPLPETFEIITPGIRRQGSAAQDQKRTATPAEAISLGATLLVIGREVTAAKDPEAAIKAVLSEISA